MRHRIATFFVVLLFVCGFLYPLTGLAQTTISTGSIQGTITDPSGAVVPGVKITISSKATGQVINLVSSSSGAYNSGALIPGDYVVKVEAAGFRTVLLPVTVQVGVTSPGSVALEVGAATTVVSVEAETLRVNTEQSTVQGVVTTDQIDRLPINGRNFLDLAALQPGIQIQDGGGFDPTKNGYSSISFAGRFGRTARIELDGVDISDETVGTTTQNIPVSAIQEFAISQSSLDLSTELTSSGAVNVVTRSGSNSFHGESFLFARSDKTSARYGDTSVPFDRQQYGVRFGGPLIKDRLFFFADWERTVQDMTQAVTLSAPFTALSGSFSAPFHESMLVGRLDWQVRPNWRAFYRWTYDQNNNEAAFIPNTYEPYSNRDNTPVQAAGLDIAQGSLSHSFRFGYTRFNNAIVDAASRKNTIDIAPGVDVHISASGATGCTTAGFLFCSGVNILAPQATVQHNLQFKYDGSKVYRSHIIRYGVGVNRILGGGYAKFYSSQPTFRSNFTAGNEATAAAGPFAGGASNPLNWPVNRLRFGNGQGYFTEIPQLGFPAGGQYDTRFAWYIGDAWKAKPNLTVTYGVRYVRDTGRSDSDLPALTTLDLWGKGLGNPPHQPNKNFAPQLGIAWDPGKNGKTVIRAGAGLYYENAVFNNVLFDRPGRLPTGLFFGLVDLCPGTTNRLPDGTTVDASAVCGQPIGNSVDWAIAEQPIIQGAYAAAGAAANPNYIDENYANGDNSTGNNFISPDYRTPFSWQFNVGMQRQIKAGTVLSVDYVRNVGLHYLLAYDTNHIGDARYLNQTAAANAIATTLANCGVGSIDAGLAPGACQFDPITGDPLQTPRSLDMLDFASNGLDSGASYLFAYPAFMFGLTPDTGPAFPGINPDLGENTMLFPIGRSVYNALQVSLRSNLTNPVRGIKNGILQISYALSRTNSMAQDQDFITDAADFANTNRYFGPNGLDRTHQISFGGSFDFPYAFRLAFNGRFATALPVNLLLPATGDPGEIFRTDVTGDGTIGDIVPGTNIGSFGRDVKVGAINQLIDSYNNSSGGKLTPAGQALVSAGLFTQGQLDSLGAVTPTLSDAPAGQLANPPSLNFGMRFGWELKPGKLWKSVPESITLEPTISIYNLFNFANYNSLDGTLNGAALSVNGTTRADRTNKVFMGSGIYAFGAPRTFEWGFRVTF
jgi:hypothetical protein